MTDDFQLLRKVAAKRWPDAELTKAQIVLALAKIAVRGIISRN